MKARIIITKDGKVIFLADEGTLESGAEKIQALIRKLAARGVNFSEVGQPEQHRHDDESITLENNLYA